MPKIKKLYEKEGKNVYPWKSLNLDRYNMGPQVS